MHVTGTMKLIEYVPIGSNSITLHANDYLCLAAGVYLNDVIIDFYLKFIVYSKLSSEVGNRVHIFSTYFYKRLTTKLKSR